MPARGGSKGIPMKNLRQIDNRSLVEIAADVAAAVHEFDRCIVSTDHPEIATVAREAGLNVPFMRPKSIAGDRVGDWDVLSHALQATEKFYNEHFDIVVMLQPTSPLRRPEDVLGTIQMLINGEYDAVWSVSETDLKAHPLKQLVVRNGKMEYWDSNGSRIIARQQLEPVYHRNGVAYAITRECLLEQMSIKGTRTGAFIVAGENISIDTEFDFELINFLKSRRQK